MKLITQEEAKQFIPCKEDFTNRPAMYYTLTECIDPEYVGFEDVTYYTGKKKNEYELREGKGNSWVYIFSNPVLPGLYKIGYTNETPEGRAKEISRGTGVVRPFKVEWAFQCFDGILLEYEIHKYLDPYRDNSRREFFRIDLNYAKQTIQKIGKNYTNSNSNLEI